MSVEELDTLQEFLGETASELAMVIASIAAGLAERSPADPIPATTTEVSVEILASLMQKAVELLRVYDSAIETVVREMASLVSSPAHKRQLQTIQGALEVYDFEGCLTLFYAWAEEEGIVLKE